MLVCKCLNLNFLEIKDAVRKYGSDIEIIKEKTKAGSRCKCCTNPSCGKVEITLPDAIEKANDELNFE